MALNEIYKDGDSLPINFGTSDPGIVSGEFVSLGSLHGVAETTATERTDGDWYATIRFTGVFAGTTADAVTVGAPIYLASAATNGTALTTSSGSGNNKLVGYAAAPKGAGAGAVWVRVNN